MAGRSPKPWFRASRGEWYVQIKGETHRLGADKAEADRQFHLLMAGEEPEPLPVDRDWMYVAEVVDEFKCFIKEENAETTLDWYLQYLEPFQQTHGMKRADKLTRDEVRDWVNKRWPTLPSRRAALRCIKSAFRKAANDGKFFSPIAAMKLPEETNRDHVVSKKDYEKLLAAITDENFKDLIRFIWMTGARAQEACIILDEFVELKEKRIVIPARLAKGKKRARVIYLPPEALKIVKARMGNGLIFQTRSGTAFTKDLVRQRFEKLEAAVHFRYCLTHFRHAFAHRSLTAGIDSLTVATLLGHSSTRMLERVYGHLMKAHDHLRKELAKAK
ncbi:MAG: site-specific tyrosine recombinase XerC [Schlesneria sp.]|nr:site-specific tyrosine recombinase XerC [Schlesneria sp.]